MLSISENILKYIAGIGIIQGILLSLLIYFHPKSDRTVNKFLALYILVTSFLMSIPFIFSTISWQNSFFVHPVQLLAGPLLYLYLRSFKEVISLRKAWPHFVIFLIYIPIAYWNTSRFSAAYPDSETIPPAVFQDPVTAVLNYIKFTQAVIYYFLARRTLISFQRSIKQIFSETTRVDINWGKLLVNGNIVLVIAATVMYTMMIRYPAYFNILLLANMAIATPYIYLATYKGILQPTIWQLQAGTDKQVIEQEIQEAEEIELHIAHPEKERPLKAGDKMDGTVAKIIALMEDEKLYQETELTLQNLAEKLTLPSYQVSQAINDGMNKNFYELVNGYRVEEAKRLLVNPKNRNYTILSVGFEAGFNSKTTFNTVFKKFTGLTPTDYREKEKQVLATPDLA